MSFVTALDEMELIAQRRHKRILRRGDEAVKLFEPEIPAADVLSEALNQVRARDAGLPVPWLSEVTKLGGKWAILSEFMEGDTLAQAMAAQPERLDEWLELFIALQLRVHAARSPELNPLREKLHRRISASGLDATTRYELHVRLDAMPRHEKICHMDFIPSNIMLIEGGEPAIIDWSHVTQGNASADAANTYLSFLRQGEEETGQAYLKLYCEMSDTAKQYLSKWLPIVAAMQLSICAKEHEAFYRSWCEDVVD
ncbi:MAG: aminoglycoside phosphotransferase family protein [Oscillospiraceae bacterium]|nr:aminoglycoside phosphotransferase family protein [Oscillospiraceae bacterium]